MRLRMLVLLALVASIAGCSASTQNTTTASKESANTSEYKIGIMTGTVSQNEEEFRAGQQLAKRYPGRVTHVTYPDNFMQEQETVILPGVPELKAANACAACSSG